MHANDGAYPNRANERGAFAYCENEYGEMAMNRLLASNAVTTITKQISPSCEMSSTPPRTRSRSARTRLQKRLASDIGASVANNTVPSFPRVARDDAAHGT